MKRRLLEIIVNATDTGYVDTISLIIDPYILADGKREYNYIQIYTGDGIKIKRRLKFSLRASEIIDTILYTDFRRCEKDIKYRNREGKITKEHQVYFINDTLKDYIFYYDPRKYYFSIMIQHSALVGKSKVEIMNEIKDFFKNYFVISDKYLNNLEKALSLSRIDYKRDYRYKDEEELSLIKFIVDIAPESIVGMNYKKEDEKDEHPDIDDFDDYEYMKKYKSSSNKTAEFVIYDKQLEQEFEFRKGKISKEQLEYFERVIRFEVRIKNRKLNSLKIKENWALDKEIDNYKDENIADMLFSQYAELAFFKEPFYRIDVAKRIIRNSNLTSYMKEKLRELLNAINKKGYTKAKQEYQYKHSFNSHIKILRSLGINPLTFGETWTDKTGNIHKTTYTKIPNFIQKENCLEEEAIIDSKYFKLMEQEKPLTRIKTSNINQKNKKKEGKKNEIPNK